MEQIVPYWKHLIYFLVTIKCNIDCIPPILSFNILTTSFLTPFLIKDYCDVILQFNKNNLYHLLRTRLNAKVIRYEDTTNYSLKLRKPSMGSDKEYCEIEEYNLNVCMLFIFVVLK